MAADVEEGAAVASIVASSHCTLKPDTRIATLEKLRAPVRIGR
jgi:hypothetical protein